MDLNKEQQKAVIAEFGPLLIVAGAGTGKTRTLTSRIISLIERGIKPEKICAITFTNKAAREMEERILNFQFPISNFQKPFIGTFHSLGARILRKESAAAERKPNFVIFDSNDSFDLIKKITKGFFPPKKGEWERSKKESPSFFAKKISEIKNLTGALENLLVSKKTEDENAIRVFREYEEQLKKNNAFDFDDLIEKPVAVFRKHPEVLRKYQQKFDAVLVDEYQDLNPKQYELIKLLAGEHKNLSVVGDDEQMIYGWRYADLKIFLDFEKDWPGAQIIFLEENYRSTGNIIGGASGVAQNNQYRRPKNLWTNNPGGSQIKIIETGDEEREARWIAKEIKNEKLKMENDGNTAILYRTNAQSRALEQALIERQIPYRIFGGLRFYERKEIKDVVAALRYAFNGNDSLSKDRLEKNLSKTKFQKLEAKILKDRSKSPLALIKAFLEATDYLEYLENNFLNFAERQENISELIDFASRFEDLGQFLEGVALMQPTDALIKNHETRSANHESGVNFVNLMTIHLAKGLEFDRVFIAGCSENLLPHSMSMSSDYQIEEERRLMYVAMTRAKKELSISFYDIPSRFIGEIPEELTNFISSGNDIGKRTGEEDEESVFID